MKARIRLAESDEEIRRCFVVIHDLRPHLELGQFVEQVKRQQMQGYHLAFLEEGEAIQACAGFRLLESLSWGRYLYVDDLVTSPAARSRGFGGELLDWLVARARTEGCSQFHLDSGVQRFAAHRFYLTKRMEIIAHHFALKL